MRLLAIETSCDETSVAIMEARLTGDTTNLSGHFRVLAHHTASQVALHAPYGGVFPTLAKREHARNLPTLLRMALDTAAPSSSMPASPPAELAAWAREVGSHEPPEFAEALLSVLTRFPSAPVEGIAVTIGPGLEPALWVGVNAARVLAKGWGIPLWGAHHLEGHLVSACATPSDNGASYSLPPVKFPLVGLIVSGGHTDLVVLPHWGERRIVGRTRDDAAGETFDKAARMLGLPYPGGPAISARAEEARERGEMLDSRLPRPMKDSASLDFSFAGLKTALRRELQKRGFDPDNPALPPELQRQFAREVEEAIVETLLAKLKRAQQQTQARTVALGGGVAANRFLAREAAAWAQREGLELRVCEARLATDNALMVGMGAALDIHLQLLSPLNPDVARPHADAPWPARSFC